MAGASSEHGSEHGSDFQIQDLSSQFLICPLCLDQYVVPKVLPCQHSFCLACLRRYVATREFDRALPCPMCKERFIIPGDDVNNFKNNFLIVSLLHFVEHSERLQSQAVDDVQSGPAVESGHVCGACTEPGQLATFCQQCCLWLCATCTKAHARLPATSSHDLQTSEEIDANCKSMVANGKAVLTGLKEANATRHTFLLTQMKQLPEDLALVKCRIVNAAEAAHKVIKEKTDVLLRQVEQFRQAEDEKFYQKLREVDNKKQELEQIGELLDSVGRVNDGFQNQNSMRQVEKYMSDTVPAGFLTQTDRVTALAFTAFHNNLNEVKNLEMGQLRVISTSDRNDPCVRDRPVGIQKVASLIERDCICSLSVNKFAHKFIVCNNQHILVFRPDSRVPSPFEAESAERKARKPWAVAFYEETQLVYLTEAGRHEGDGAVISFTPDGKFHSVLASNLTLPRGIAVHGGQVFVCDAVDKCVYIFSTKGKVLQVLKKTADGKFLFTSPMFISVGRSGVFAVCDNEASVKVFDQDRVLCFTYTSPLPESQLRDVHVLPDNTVVVCDWKHGLHRISADFTMTGPVRLESGTILREPLSLAGLENGNSIYIGTGGGEIFSAL